MGPGGIMTGVVVLGVVVVVVGCVVVVAVSTNKGFSGNHQIQIVYFYSATSTI